MKNTLFPIAILLFSIHSSAAESSLAQQLVRHVHDGSLFVLSKGSENCDTKLMLTETVVPQSQTQTDLRFGSIRLRADLDQGNATMIETIDGVELTYRQSSGPKILTLSHYLPRVRNQLVRFYSTANILTVEAIEYNYDSTPNYKYCEYLIK